MTAAKPEYMTSLHGRKMVPKTHDRIVFRGAVDTLQAEVLEAQILASGSGEQWYCDALGEILTLLRGIMKSEVTGAPLKSFTLFGFSETEMHWQSQNTEKVFGLSDFTPEYSYGPLAVRLNYLRTRSREAEICAVRVYHTEENLKNNILMAMNRLSSALWWLYCRYTAAHKSRI